MNKAVRYREKLQKFKDWDSFLLKESGLPGPRANLELVQAVVEEGDEELFQRFLTFTPEKAPTNSPYEFLAVCGVVGLGRLISEGKASLLKTLRLFASDPRWRIREGVAMALQRLGEKDMNMLLQEMDRWSEGSLLEMRAAAAGVCEPRLLQDKKQTGRVLKILDKITASLQKVEDRKSEEFRVLRKGLGYCWSVAVVALPEEGKKLMEKWFLSKDKDIIWIMRENLKKNRLVKMDKKWVEKWKKKLEG